LLPISPLSGYVFFVDRNIGRYQVPDALRSLGLTVEVHADHFPAQETVPEVWDGQWIQTVTALGWIIITRDKGIRRNPLERAAFVGAGARVFNIRSGSASAASVASAISAAATQMRAIIETHAAPFIVGVSMSGNLTFIDRA
jgi:hypothetical protein